MSMLPQVDAISMHENVFNLHRFHSRIMRTMVGGGLGPHPFN